MFCKMLNATRKLYIIYTCSIDIYRAINSETETIAVVHFKIMMSNTSFNTHCFWCFKRRNGSFVDIVSYAIKHISVHILHVCFLKWQLLMHRTLLIHCINNTYIINRYIINQYIMFCVFQVYQLIQTPRDYTMIYWGAMVITSSSAQSTIILIN